MRKVVDMTGQKFGRLTVINEAGRSKCCKALWLCVCSCGGNKVVLGRNLKKGTTKSCGCLRKEISKVKATTHGLSNSRTYSIWANLIQRCCNKKDKDYCNYGGRGISVCGRWLDSFNNFLEDMGMPPRGGSIDRLNNNGNYEPGNCRWTTRKEQARNRRTNKLITYKGKTRPIVEWSEEVGINRNTLLDRINRGWSVERALTEPVNHKREGVEIFEEMTNG